MNRKRQNWKKIIPTFIIGCCLLAACEMQADQEILATSESESLEVALQETREFMYDDPIRGISSLDEIIDQAKSQNSALITGKALWYQAYLQHQLMDDVSKAYFAYKESLKYLDQTTDAITKAKVRNNLAVLNEYYGQYDFAISIYQSILEDRDKLAEEQLSNVYYNLGRNYKLKGDEESFFKAEDAFTQSLELAQSIDHHRNIARANNQVGMMYKDLADYDMSRIAYRNTIRDYQNDSKSDGVLDFVGQAYHGMGVTYMEQERFDEANEAFREALKYKTDSESIFITKYDLGSVLFELGQPMEAIATWKDALKEKHNKNERIQVEIYAKLTSALAAHNEYADALMYAQIYNEHISNILSEGEKYQAENNRVIFADIIREYDEFNQVIPFYKEPWAIVLMFIFIALAVYTGSRAYYQSKLSTKVSDTRSEIQIEFQNIKLD
ncbi:MAG: tetratricopeptide repeat protein [Cytophagales bacterium]|nr:tetratricopeptide repeat protein [Cytophagales bacterium]